MWWRFRRHRMAMVGTAVVLVFYAAVVFADFLAYSDPGASEAQRSLLPPQRINFFQDGRFAPYVYGLTGKRDPMTFKRVYTPDPEKKIAVQFFAHGFEYRFLGLFPTDRHLLGLEGARAEDALFVIGTDEQGRDLWSRLMYGTRTSLTISGVVGKSKKETMPLCDIVPSCMLTPSITASSPVCIHTFPSSSGIMTWAVFPGSPQYSFMTK